MSDLWAKLSYPVNTASSCAKRLNSALECAIAPNDLFFSFFFEIHLPPPKLPAHLADVSNCISPSKDDACCCLLCFPIDYAWNHTFSCSLFNFFLSFSLVFFGGTVWCVTCRVLASTASRFQFCKAVVRPQMLYHFRVESFRITAPFRIFLPPFNFTLVHQPSMPYSREKCPGVKPNGAPCKASWNSKYVRNQVLFSYLTLSFNSCLWQAKVFDGRYWCYSCNMVHACGGSSAHSQGAQRAAIAAAHSAAQASLTASGAADMVIHYYHSASHPVWPTGFQYTFALSAGPH